MGEEAIHVTRLLQKCSVSKNKKAEKKKGQAQMQREIFKAVLADFCRETG